MAASSSVALSSSSPKNLFLDNDKCRKCEKVLKTGITCKVCNHSYHFRCAKIDASVKENNEFMTSWSCTQCCLKSSGKTANTNNWNCKCELSILVKDLISEIQCLKVEVSLLNKRVSENDQQHLMNCRPKSKTPEIFPTFITNNKYQALDQIVEEVTLKPTQIENNLSICKKSDSNMSKKQVINPCASVSECKQTRPIQRNDSEIRQITYMKPPKVNKRRSEKQKRKKGRILIYGDSHGRGIAQNIVNMQDDFEAVAHIQPGAPLSAVATPCVRDSESFSVSDSVVIIGGTNDVAKNQANDAIRHMKTTLGKLIGTKVVVVNIPQRYDLMEQSVVNLEVHKTNDRLKKICNKFHNVSLINISNLDRDLHTTHGMHLNKRGKMTLSKLIIDEIRRNSQQSVINTCFAMEWPTPPHLTNNFAKNKPTTAPPYPNKTEMEGPKLVASITTNHTQNQGVRNSHSNRNQGNLKGMLDILVV